MSDWLPRTRNARIAMARQWLEVLGAPAYWVYGVSQAEYTWLWELAGTADVSNHALQEGYGNRRLHKEAADDEKALVALMRQLHRRFKGMRLSNAQVVALGLNPHDSPRTDLSVVREHVGFTLRVGSAILEVLVDFWIHGADRKARHAGYESAVVIYAVLDAPPSGYDDLVYREMAAPASSATHPHTLHFDMPDRGRTVYVALCWQNERGIRGAWSEIKSMVIP